MSSMTTSIEVTIETFGDNNEFCTNGGGDACSYFDSETENCRLFLCVDWLELTNEVPRRYQRLPRCIECFNRKTLNYAPDAQIVISRDAGRASLRELEGEGIRLRHIQIKPEDSVEYKKHIQQLMRHNIVCIAELRAALAREEKGV